MRSVGSLSPLPLAIKLGILAAGCAIGAAFVRHRRGMDWRENH